MDRASLCANRLQALLERIELVILLANGSLQGHGDGIMRSVPRHVHGRLVSGFAR